MNILIFRTDRIGDFFLTSILIKSIKRNFPNSNISVICSYKNYDFIKRYSLVENAYLFEKRNFWSLFKLKNILNKKKIDYVFIIDGKQRSIIFSLFIKAKEKFYTLTKRNSKILKIVKNKSIIYDNEIDFNKIDIIKKNLKLLNCDLIEDDFDIFKNEKFMSKFDLDRSKININKYLILHLDEKWVYEKYIQEYLNIQPNIQDLVKFLNKLIDQKKINLVITSGIEKNILFEKLKSTFSKLEDNIYKKDYNNFAIFLFDSVNIYDLIFLISKASLLITCHGAPSHIASSLNVKSIDIIDPSEHILFNKWTSHLRQHNQISRKEFSRLSEEIVNLC